MWWAKISLPLILRINGVGVLVLTGLIEFWIFCFWKKKGERGMRIWNNGIFLI
jgi:hypothetical protein